MAQEEQKDELHTKDEKNHCVQIRILDLYVLKDTERRNILARQLRGNKSSLWGYEMSKDRDHHLHPPKLGNTDYEDLVPRFPNRYWDVSIKRK